MKYILLLLFLSATSFVIAQEDYLKEINDSWASYAEAFITKDFKKVTTFSHPMVVEKSGGSSYFMNDLLYDQGMYESAGLQITALEAKQPSLVIPAGEELHAMLPYERVFLSGEEKIVEQHFALAASQDEGKTWNFFDLSKQDAESIKIYLPHYDERLNVYFKK